MILIYLDEKSRLILFKILIYSLVFNDLVLFAEFLVHHRVLPYQFETVEQSSQFFRPTAFLGHPLINGLFNATSVCFAWLMPWSYLRRGLLSFFFLLAAFAAQGRIASLFALIGFGASIWIVLFRVRRKGAVDEGVLSIAMLGTVLALAFILAIILMTGLGQRLLALGLNDKSSQARFEIYRVFTYLTPAQFLFGAQRDWGAYLITKVLGLMDSESPIVSGVLEFGLVGSLIIFPAIVQYLWALARRGNDGLTAVGVAIFLLIGLTNPTFTSKGPALTFISILALTAPVVYRRRPLAKIATARLTR